jgi:Aspartyl protease
VIELDFPGRRVRFLDPRRYEVPKRVDAPDEAVIPFKLVATRISVPVELGGREVGALFDTGSPVGLSLAGKATARLGIDVDALPDFGEMGTVLGSERVKLYEAPKLSLAGFEFQRAPVVVAPRGGYQQGLATDNALGYDLMQPFVIRIDYKHRRMWLHRTAPLRSTLIGADFAAAKEIGAYLTPVGPELNVWGVTPGGPASSFGLRNGDRVVAPSGEAPPKLEDVLEHIKARQELTVSRQRGGAWVDLVLPEAPGAP